MSERKIETTCVQGGYTPGNGEPRQIPIYQSTTFKYDTLGKKVGDLLNGAFAKIEWELIGKTLSKSINKTFEIIFNFADTFEWEKHLVDEPN